jgi:glyoxylase I family protein
VTTTAPSGHIAGLDPEFAPVLQGISHVGLTVADLDRAIDFWCRVMGFRVVIKEQEYCMVWQASATLAIGLTAHSGSAVGPFDEHHVGLDHLALAVADVPTLSAWATRFAELSVPHSPIDETDAGHHLNVRAPDNLAVELFAIKADFAGTVLGVDNGNGAAHTHH